MPCCSLILESSLPGGQKGSTIIESGSIEALSGLEEEDEEEGRKRLSAKLREEVEEVDEVEEAEEVSRSESLEEKSFECLCWVRLCMSWRASMLRSS